MKRWIIAVLMAAVCITLAACGGSGAERVADASPASPGEARTAMTVEDFLYTSPGLKGANSFKNSAEASGNCTARCYADGNIMVFEGKFLAQIEPDMADTVNNAIDRYLNDEEIILGMEEIVQSLADYGVISPQAKIVFLSCDGEVLGERIYG